MSDRAAAGDAAATGDQTVGALAEVYLGNILYALELAALSLEEQQRPQDASFYRGIARTLADARGRQARGSGGPETPAAPATHGPGTGVR